MDIKWIKSKKLIGVLNLIRRGGRYGKKFLKNSPIGKGFLFWNTKDRKLPIQELPIQERLENQFFHPLLLVPVCVILWLAGWLCGQYLMPGSDWAYVLILLGFVCFLGLLGMFFFHSYRQKRLAEDLGLLCAQIDAACEGRTRAGLAMPQDSDLAEMAGKVAGIQDGLEKAVEARMKSERMKVELVANVSHDIKTPLTSIISYVSLLQEEENLPDEAREYVDILAQKSARLKSMVQDIFEVSRAVSGQLPMKMEVLDFGKLLRQTLADMEEQIAGAAAELRTQIPTEPVLILADGQRLYRVFQNLIENALRYSLEGSRIYLTLQKKGNLAVASVHNTSKSELPSGMDFTARFVRGDASRTDGGSGLGLSIAKSFTEACGGRFAVETIADLFVVKVEFAQKEE